MWLWLTCYESSICTLPIKTIISRTQKRSKCQTHFHWGPHQPCGCLQRAKIILGLYKCNYSLTVKEFKLHSALWRQSQGWCGPRWEWVWHPWSKRYLPTFDLIAYHNIHKGRKHWNEPKVSKGLYYRFFHTILQEKNARGHVESMKHLV